MIARLPPVALKTGRYELAARLSTSVKDNLWSNKSVTRSPAIPPLSLALSFYGIKISACSSLNLSTLPSRRRLTSQIARNSGRTCSKIDLHRDRHVDRKTKSLSPASSLQCPIGRDMFFLGRECPMLTYYARNTCGAERS